MLPIELAKFERIQPDFSHLNTLMRSSMPLFEAYQSADEKIIPQPVFGEKSIAHEIPVGLEREPKTSKLWAVLRHYRLELHGVETRPSRATVLLLGSTVMEDISDRDYKNGIPVRICEPAILALSHPRRGIHVPLSSEGTLQRLAVDELSEIVKAIADKPDKL